MIEYLVNIGRDRNDCNAQVTWVEAHRALHDAGFGVIDMQERESSTESTFVVLVRDRLNSIPYCRARFYGVAERLHQDCIAVVLLKHPHSVTGEFEFAGVMGGQLFGPKAADWAPFKAEYFLGFTSVSISAN